MRASLSCGVVFAFLFSWGSAFATSAVRLPGEAYEAAAERAYEEFTSREPGAAAMRGGSAESLSKPFDEVDFSSAPVVDSYRRLFVRLRDERFQEDPDKAGFSRRISWLYPYDGCFTRAGAASKRASDLGWTRPANVYAFGRLFVQTKNSPTGSVGWWYHVAPVVNDRFGKTWVLDPAMDPSGPLPVEAWLKEMAPLSKIKVALCSEYNWEPFRPCDESDTSNEERMVNRQKSEYLPAERSNLIKLQRDPDKELGDSPPWKLGR